MATLSDFIDYWDHVVANWFEGHAYGDEPLWFKEAKTLNFLHMPEPYWGNPKHCSIVIANYNPGGGADRSRHTYLPCAGCSDSFINEVKKSSYSEVALSFPIIKDPKNLLKGFYWWKEYGGRKWWLDKLDWIKDAYNLLTGIKVDDESFKPFVMEFCAWHCPKWSDNKSIVDLYYANKRTGATTPLAKTIDEYFIEPLTAAIKASTCKYGICVGSQFHYLFKQMEKDEKNVRLVKSKDIGNGTCCYYIINNANVIVIWGNGYNRYPNLQGVDFKELLNKKVILL